MATYQLIAATGCPTGIAHTYMAQEALEQAAKRKGITIKVETHGQIGRKRVNTCRNPRSGGSHYCRRQRRSSRTFCWETNY